MGDRETLPNGNGGSRHEQKLMGFAQEMVNLGLEERDLRRRKELIRLAERRQTEFILQAALEYLITTEDRELVRGTKELLRTDFEKRFNQLAGAVRTSEGRIIPGLQFDAKVEEASFCSERRALYKYKDAAKSGETLEALTSVRCDEVGMKVVDGKLVQDYAGRKSRYYHVVGPCALCRDGYSHLTNNEGLVIIPKGESEICKVPNFLLFPDEDLLKGVKKFSNPKLQTLAEQYRQLLLDISQNFPLTKIGNGLIKEAKFKLAKQVNKDSQKRLAFFGAGFSGQTYGRIQLEEKRSEFTLIVGKGADSVISHEATENHDPLHTIVSLTGSQDQEPEVVLPTGMAREEYRQFQPLSFIIVDFGKDGIRKLPISVVYPLVYMERKRKNS